MSFLLGGFRFREQIYNSTVTQMSACLLSLSVTSLLLPTAFHASFNNSSLADTRVLQVSRGTSVVLLLVYIMYLLFQLNSHAYMYESTPQHVIERESVPWETSSSSSSDSSSDDSDSSSNAATRIKRKIKGKMSRKQSTSTTEPSVLQPKLEGTAMDLSEKGIPSDSDAPAEASASVTETDLIAPVIGADDDMAEADEFAVVDSRRQKRKHKRRHHRHRRDPNTGEELVETQSLPSRQVEFAIASDLEAQQANTLAKASIFKSLRQNVFVAPPQASGTAPSGTRQQVRRVHSMPVQPLAYRNAPGSLPPIVPIVVNSKPRPAPTEEKEEEEPEISRTTAILILLCSTGLVALCAEFMVNSIEGVVASGSGVSETFIGLILLPIVGNAAEHVTSVTVAIKNKMDLAIGVALGSSIQIAIFVTPLVVILGWIMNKDMSLFFTLFETVSLFVSAFIVNFLVLDGRSNYLEGALLCSAYIIIAVAAFFYPNVEEANSLGGGTDTNSTGSTEAVVAEVSKLLVRSVTHLAGL